MKLSETEKKFMNYIWELEPVSSKQIVQICDEEFGWKKSTTYTFLKRLSDKGALINDDSMIRSLISKTEIQKEESQAIIESTFDGSFLSFATAFFSSKGISEEEYVKLKELIDSMKENDD